MRRRCGLYSRWTLNERDEEAMSYDIYLHDPKTGSVIEFDSPHDRRGGTYAAGGTCEAWLNITYNYGAFYYEHIDAEKGIRKLYGMTGEQAIPILEKAIADIGDAERSGDYWDSNPGNARAALIDLLALAKAAPHGVFDGD